MIFSFGPHRYDIATDADVSARLAPFVTREACENHWTARTAVQIDSHESERVVLSDNRMIARGPGFVANFAPPPHATLRAGGDHGAVSLESLLGTLVVRDSTKRACFVMHAAGVRNDSSVSLIVGASGIGKSTLARRAGTRAFCYNAALVDREGLRAWPLPFTGREDPPVTCIDPLPIGACVVLEPGGPARAERSTGSAATNAVLRHVVVLRGDAEAIETVAMAIRFSLQVPMFRLRRPADPDTDLSIDSLVRTGTLPP